MPISLDDQMRLPPMMPYPELTEKERLADMKEFRKYLVETGTASCLVKLYKHIAKNEMRLDNHSILKEFFETHNEETDATREADRLSDENAALRDKNAELQARVEALTKELDVQQRGTIGKRIWQQLAGAAFWGEDASDMSSGFPLKLLFQRLCGQKVHQATGMVMVNLLRPSSLDEAAPASSITIDLEAFSAWIANDISDDIFVWCRDELVARLEAEDKLPPYEKDAMQAIRDTGSYASRVREDVADCIDLIPSLRPLFAFLEAVTTRFCADA